MRMAYFLLARKVSDYRLNVIRFGTKFIALTFGLFIAVTTHAYTEGRDENFKKYKDFMPEQITALSKEARDKIPMNILWAADLSLLPDRGSLAISMRLNQLMYSGLGNLSAAINAFQADLGEKVTGKLTVGQLVELTDRARSLEVNIPYLDTTLFASDSKIINMGYASVSGSLEIIGEKIANPINRTNIQCSKAEGKCRLERVSLNIPERNSFWTAVLILGPSSEEKFPIVSWSETNIETGISDNSACRVRSLSLNFTTKEYFYITKNGHNYDQQFCKDMPRLDGPRVARVVDGREMYNREKNKISDKQFEVMSSSFKAESEKLFNLAKNAERGKQKN